MTGGGAPLVCLCGRVTRRRVLAAIRRGAATVDDLGVACGAGISCRSCHRALQRLLECNRGTGASSRGESARPRQLSLWPQAGGKGRR